MREESKHPDAKTLCIKTMYGDTYEVDNVRDYGYSKESHHYWYTNVYTSNNEYNYVRADRLLYFGLKECCIKEV